MTDVPMRPARCGLRTGFAVAVWICCSLPAMAQTPQVAQPQFGQDSVPPPAQSAPQAQGVPPIQSAPQTQSMPLPPPQDAPPRKREGFFDALGRWLDKSAQDFKSSVDESNAKWRELGAKTEKMAKDAAAAQKEAADAFKNLSNVRMVEGRRVCEPAPNGSPDCQTAAEVICRDKGYAAGKSADIQTSRKCSAKAWLSRNDGDCKVETVVVKAACQ